MITIAMLMVMVRSRMQPPMSFSNSTPQDELQALVHALRARSVSVPSPMATSAATACPTPVTPRLNGSASPRPPFAITMMIGQLS
ncbi:MAG: hypothetical protein OXC15_12235 [Rhodospirillaceae bacterium]|nr:hypothetical protein [Rhodospirillaceae bacterium]